MLVKSPGVQVSLQDAEATRRQLMADGLLRKDLRPAKDEDTITFPTTEGEAMFDFARREVKVQHYTEHLDWSESELALAPRAFDVLGDTILVKVPEALWPQREALGEAMRAFHKARAVFHDGGVTGEFRTRDLQRLAGEGTSQTTVQENGVRLIVDPAMAYYSPRLANERERITGLSAAGESVIDLFGGVAPQGVQLAKAGASVISVDLNPAACELARQNAAANKVELDVRCGDARLVAKQLAPADRVIMNLPHGAKHFLAEGKALTKPGGTLHHHEIIADAKLPERQAALEEIGRVRTVRHVRNYSAAESHYVFDLEIA